MLPIMRSAAYARYAWFLLAVNLLVILLGTVVRATHSGDGCGSHWPVCNGALVPLSPTINTLIEYSHRVTSGLDGLLVLGLCAAALRLFPRGHRARRAAGLALALTVIEGLLGRHLVKARLVADDASAARAVWMSIHLCNTFLLLAALALSAFFASAPLHHARRAARTGRERLLAALLLLGLGLVMLLGVSGAVTALGDTLFPAHSHEEVLRLSRDTSAHFLLRQRVLHPYLAVLIGALLFALASFAGRRGRQASLWSLALRGVYCLQLLCGLCNLWLRAPVAMQVLHLLLADLVWLALVLLSAAVLYGEEDQPAR